MCSLLFPVSSGLWCTLTCRFSAFFWAAASRFVFLALKSARLSGDVRIALFIGGRPCFLDGGFGVAVFNGPTSDKIEANTSMHEITVLMYETMVLQYQMALLVLKYRM